MTAARGDAPQTGTPFNEENDHDHDQIVARDTDCGPATGEKA